MGQGSQAQAQPITGFVTHVRPEPRCSAGRRTPFRSRSQAVRRHEGRGSTCRDRAARDTIGGVGAIPPASAPPIPDRVLRCFDPTKGHPVAMSSTAASLIHPSVIKAVSISLKPAPRERVRRASPFSVRSIISATDTGHLPAPGATDARGKVVIGIAALPDTDTHASRRGKLVRVAVNANANALVREHEAGRLTAEAYFAGVIYQELLERSHGMTKPSRGEWLMPMGGNKVNGQAHALVKKLEHAEFAASCFRDTARIIGMTGGRILELCLIGTGDGDGPKTFSQVAEIMGVTLRAQSETDASYLKRCKNDGMKIGWAFRDALNLLASGWELGGAPALPKRWGK